MIKLSAEPTEQYRPNPTFIPVRISGGIGDMIMAIDALDELEKHFAIVRYTTHIEAFKYFSSAYVEKLMPEYTWHLNINSICRFEFSKYFDGFLLDEHKQLFHQQIKLFDKDPLLEDLVRHHATKDYLLCKHAKHLRLDRRTLALYSLGLDVSNNS